MCCYATTHGVIPNGFSQILNVKSHYHFIRSEFVLFQFYFYFYFSGTNITHYHFMWQSKPDWSIKNHWSLWNCQVGRENSWSLVEVKNQRDIFEAQKMVLCKNKESIQIKIYSSSFFPNLLCMFEVGFSNILFSNF